MSKGKKFLKALENSLREQKTAAKKLMMASIEEGEPKLIMTAEIKDDLCNYVYEITGGKAKGFKHTVNGVGIIDQDMRNAFAKLNVHLAFIDDVYKHSDIQIGNIDSMHNDELALLYTVTGFKIKGGDENESIVLIGNKYLSAGSRMKLESPKIPIDNTSSYKWYNELKAAADSAREEVALYHYGFYTPVKEEVEEEKTQVSITFGPGDGKDAVEETVDDFERAKV